MKRYTVLVDSEANLQEELSAAIAERFDATEFVVSDAEGSVEVEELVERQLLSFPEAQDD